MSENGGLPEGLIRLEPNETPKEEKLSSFEKVKYSESSKKVTKTQQPIEERSLPAKAAVDEMNQDTFVTPKITRIQAQKRKGRYNIFLDGEYAFPVDEALIVKHLLRKGMEISPQLQETLKTEDNFRKGYQRALNYLSYGLRSEKEVREDLADKEFIEQADDIVEKLKEQCLINDEEYAKAYVRTAANLNRKGPRVIQNELKRRGIHELNIQGALPEYVYDDQVDNAVILAEKQWKKGKQKSQRETVQKVKQHLMKKGFDMDVIQAAIEIIDTDKDENEEYEALVTQGEKAWQRYARKVDGYELKRKTKAYLFNKGYPSELINQFIDEKEEDLN